MPWNTARGWAIKQIAFGFLAMVIAIAAGLPSAAQDSRRGQGRMLADPPANAGNATSAQASNSLAVTPRSTTADNNSSSRRNLDYPAPQIAAQGSSKNGSSAADGAFADGDASATDQQSAAADDNTPAFATTFNDPPARPAASVEAASFSGVQPGVTTAEDLADQWGKGKEISHEDNQTVVSFERPSFPHVEVTLVDNKVRSVVINLDQSVPTDTLARELHLDGVRPVDVPDDSGELLGQAYPERGVLFSITPDGKRVSHVLLDKIDLSTFILRAEMELNTHTRSSLADIDYVLSHQPKNARALWLRGRLMMTMARYDEALDDVEAALEIEPKQPLFHLTHAQILGLQDKYDDAVQETKNVLSLANIPGDVKAKALCQLGDLLANSPSHDYKVAMEHHLAAIKLADPLSIDKHLMVRRNAKLVLVDAHLAVANDIASGYWQQKEKVVPKWLDRAHAYVEDLIAHEDGDPELRLRLAKGALAACNGSEGKIDSVPWAHMALQMGKPLIAAAADPWTKLALQWELGVALSDGLAADQLRGTVQHAMPNTALTISYIEAGAKGRRETPVDAFRLGWLYYHLGSLHAVQKNDHKTAIAWYEKAFPLLDRPIPPTLRNQQAHYGEWLVSMGISYWETGSHDFALQLTDAGTQHVQEAVRRNLVDEKALAIPYGNLAFMHDALGHKNEAQNFSQLASKYDGSGQSNKH